MNPEGVTLCIPFENTQLIIQMLIISGLYKTVHKYKHGFSKIGNMLKNNH